MAPVPCPECGSLPDDVTAATGRGLFFALLVERCARAIAAGKAVNNT